MWQASQYQVSTDLYFARLGSDGQKIGLDQRIVQDPYEFRFHDFVWTGAAYGLAWDSTRDGNWEVYFARLDLTGAKLGSELRITDDPAISRSPSLVWNGSGFGVAFSDNRSAVANIHLARVGCGCADLDGDGYSNCIDCDETRADVYPDSLEICDGADNNCNGLMDDGLGIVTCGMGACASSSAACYQGVSHACVPGQPTAEICDGQDNDCDGILPLAEIDGDADGFVACAECDDANASTYPGAPEVNDGFDNQCDGEEGYGLIDEITGPAGFTNANDLTEFSWPPQGGAAGYETVRSEDPRFLADCVTFPTIVAQVNDTDSPATGNAFYYFVRADAPSAGSWGRDSSGNERAVICGN